MNYDELKKIWVEDGSTPTDPAPSVAEWVDRAISRGKKLRRRVFFRDLSECLTAVALIILFSAAAFTIYPRITDGEVGWPYLAIAAGCAVVLFGFLSSRRRSANIRHSLDDGQVLGGLLAQREELRLQIALLRNVFWWYLLPLWPGIIWVSLDIALRVAANNRDLSVLDTLFAPPGSMILIFSAVSVFIYWLNRTVARKHLEPQLRDIQALIAQWQEQVDEPQDGTDPQKNPE